MKKYRIRYIDDTGDKNSVTILHTSADKAVKTVLEWNGIIKAWYVRNWYKKKI